MLKPFVNTEKITTFILIMRILSIILSVYVLFLTIFPALPMALASEKTGHCKRSCCMTNEQQRPTPPSDQQNKDCCKDVCNPFMRCCNCYALIRQPQPLSSPFTYFNQKFTLLIQTPSSDFLSDAWHPPQIA